MYIPRLHKVVHLLHPSVDCDCHCQAAAVWAEVDGSRARRQRCLPPPPLHPPFPPLALFLHTLRGLRDQRISGASDPRICCWQASGARERSTRHVMFRSTYGTELTEARGNGAGERMISREYSAELRFEGEACGVGPDAWLRRWMGQSSGKATAGSRGVASSEGERED